jgi:hypothetical protein
MMMNITRGVRRILIVSTIFWLMYCIVHIFTSCDFVDNEPLVFLCPANLLTAVPSWWITFQGVLQHNGLFSWQAITRQEMLGLAVYWFFSVPVVSGLALWVIGWIVRGFKSPVPNTPAAEE